MKNKKFKMTKNVSWQFILDDFIIVDERDRKLYSMNNTSKEMFKCVLDGYSVEESVKKLSEHYCVEATVIKKDYETFINKMMEMGFVE